MIPVLHLILSSYLLVRAHGANFDDVGLNTIELLTKHEYLCETHNVKTEDGYILTIHRVPSSFRKQKTRPVLVMHGLLSSSTDFVNMGTNRSLGYILADAGYDVWLANARGNTWSRNHTTLHPVRDKSKFWDFSWHEIGVYDLPAIIDHILKLTGHKDLYYIGHSQGCTAFFVLTAMRPEYNAKIKIASLMAPAVLQEHNDNPRHRLLSPFINQVYSLAKHMGFYELPYLSLMREFGKRYCINPAYEIACVVIMDLLGATPDDLQFDKEKIPVIMSNVPADASVKQMIHYGQLVQAGGFSQFDYGAENNLRKYGSKTPPKYDLSKVTTPIAIYFGFNDRTVNHKDIENLASSLPNLVINYEVPLKEFNHPDFIYARDVGPLVYEKLLNIMKSQ